MARLTRLELGLSMPGKADPPSLLGRCSEMHLRLVRSGKSAVPKRIVASLRSSSTMGQGGLTGVSGKSKNYRKITNFAIFRTLRKFTEKLLKIYGKPQKLRNNYIQNTNSCNFPVFFVIFG